jgi:hypothetical protein
MKKKSGADSGEEKHKGGHVVSEQSDDDEKIWRTLVVAYNYKYLLSYVNSHIYLNSFWKIV